MVPSDIEVCSSSNFVCVYTMAGLDVTENPNARRHGGRGVKETVAGRRANDCFRKEEYGEFDRARR